MDRALESDRAPKYQRASGVVLAQFGAGGTLAYADLDSGLAFAICPNRMFAKPALGTIAAPFEQLGEALFAHADAAA